MITLYGISWSRSNYVLFTLEELELDYHVVSYNPIEDEKNNPDYFRLNPLGQMPTLVDDDFVLTESMAINFYLARKYGANRLWAESLEDEAQIYKWTFYAITQLEPHCINLILHRKALPEQDRKVTVAKSAEKLLAKPLNVLNDTLDGKAFLVADRFTIADINMAGILSYALNSGFDCAPFPNVQRYLNDILSRPARKRAEAA